MNKEIAIIIPAYNAHDTIERLLFSILNQSVKDLCRVYLIDDCSEKDYFYLIDKFPWLDMVICRLDENGGPSIARNKGVELVIEDNIPYIVFADADDCFYSYNSIEVLYKEYNTLENDFVISDFLEETEKGFITIHDCDIWLFGKMYKTEIIKKENIHFPKINQNEDVGFNLWYFLSCKNTVSIPISTYCWLNNFKSITRKNNGEYANYCLQGLCLNLVEIYENVLQSKTISHEKILHSLANKIIRIYSGYNNRYFNQEKFYETEVFNAIVLFYNKIYKNYEQAIDGEIFNEEWNYLQKTIVHYPKELSFDIFIKKIREA